MLTKQQLEDAVEVTLTLDQSRADEFPEDLSVALDETQAKVFSGDAKEAILIVRIVP